jgi:hypothetical protein
MDGCFSCGLPAAFCPVDDVSVCKECAKRIAMLVFRASSHVVAGIWSVTGSPPGAHQRPVPPASYDPQEVERLFAEFMRGVEKQLAPQDMQAHLDLAVAFCEMGLHGDALREAAVTLQAALAMNRRESETPKDRYVMNDGKMVDAALKVLLTAPLLKEEGLRVLRSALHSERELN